MGPHIDTPAVGVVTGLEGIYSYPPVSHQPDTMVEGVDDDAIHIDLSTLNESGFTFDWPAPLPDDGQALPNAHQQVSSHDVDGTMRSAQRLLDELSSPVLGQAPATAGSTSVVVADAPVVVSTPSPTRDCALVERSKRVSRVVPLLTTTTTPDGSSEQAIAIDVSTPVARDDGLRPRTCVLCTCKRVCRRDRWPVPVDVASYLSRLCARLPSAAR